MNIVFFLQVRSSWTVFEQVSTSHIVQVQNYLEHLPICIQM